LSGDRVLGVFVCLINSLFDEALKHNNMTEADVEQLGKA
jgi:hypothetical protein